MFDDPPCLPWCGSAVAAAAGATLSRASTRTSTTNCSLLTTSTTQIFLVREDQLDASQRVQSIFLSTLITNKVQDQNIKQRGL